MQFAGSNVLPPCSFTALTGQNVSSSFQFRHQLPSSAKPGNSVRGFIANTEIQAVYKLSLIGVSFVKGPVQAGYRVTCSGQKQGPHCLLLSGGSVA